MTHHTPRSALRFACGTAVATVLAGGTALAGMPFADPPTATDLVIARIAPAQAPDVDGAADDAAWQQAAPLTLPTRRGGTEGVPVTVHAVHDGDFAYFRLEWPDATRSQKHLPLQKTADGWRVLTDEGGYFEDKLTLLFAPTDTLGGARPAAASSAPVADIWQWRSVRTGAFDMMDDNHIKAPQALTRVRAGDAGGIGRDPTGSGGGFIRNWTTLPDGRVRPRFLPKDPEMLGEMGAINLDPQASDHGEWWLAKEDTVAYRPEMDADYPPGTVVPSVVIDGPFLGDRGDVEAVATWRRGRWTMEVKRRLDTGSPYDVALADGVHMWVAVFDHAETRESRQPLPVRVVVD